MALSAAISLGGAEAPFPPFVPRVPWWGADLQTLRNVLRGPAFRRDAGPPREGLTAAERIELPLGDATGDRLVARAVAPIPERVAALQRTDAPTVVLVHGLGGSSDSAYIQATTAFLLAEGYAVVQLNLRGAGESRPFCREQYHAGRSEDLAAALAGLPSRWCANGLVVVGFSLGGNVSLKFAAEYGGVRGVASVSAPIDLRAASMCFLEPRNRLYHLYLLSGMKKETLSTPEGLSAQEEKKVRALSTILEFDEHIVAPRNGFRDAEDYYAQNHARQFLASIEIPTLVMHAQDDPWIPAAAYLDYPWAQNPHLMPLLPKGGGHVGFHGRGSRVPWHDRCLAVFLERLGETKYTRSA